MDKIGRIGTSTRVNQSSSVRSAARATFFSMRSSSISISISIFSSYPIPIIFLNHM